MYTKAALLDIHQRTHRSLTKFFEHLRGFSEEELGQTIEGFGMGNILSQLEHIVEAEEYWLWVATKAELPPLVDHPPPALEETIRHREEVAARTRAFIENTSEAELNTKTTLRVYGGAEVDLMPAQIVLRTQTHVFQHLGQIAAICRMLGKPIPEGFDFPLRD
ncbi:MAG: DinB family protein [Planctomycetes bacterium]|nr:DinB family protein [Planctomycetota bacterium]